MPDEGTCDWQEEGRCVQVSLGNIFDMEAEHGHVRIRTILIDSGFTMFIVNKWTQRVTTIGDGGEDEW